MLASFLITFREGLEAFLLVGIMLSYLDRLGALQYRRYLYLGVVGGVLASAGVAFLFQVVISQFENEYYQQCLMVFILLFASGVLSYMAIWMQRQSRERTANVQQELGAHISSGNLVGMVSLAFVAVLREGFETVLFFSALVYAEGDVLSLRGGLGGALLGVVSSILLVYLLLRSTRRLALAPFFKYTGLLLIVIAAGLFSSGINLMQAVEWLPTLDAPLFDISFLLDDRGGVGLFIRALFGYNASPTLLQFAGWVSFLGAFVYFWRQAYAPQPA